MGVLMANVCLNTLLFKLLTVSGWLTLSNTFHHSPSLLRFTPNYLLCLLKSCTAVTSAGAQEWGECGQWSSHNILLVLWVCSSNEASCVWGFTSMDWVIQWAEITQLYVELKYSGGPVPDNVYPLQEPDWLHVFKVTKSGGSVLSKQIHTRLLCSWIKAVAAFPRTVEFIKSPIQKCDWILWWNQRRLCLDFVWTLSWSDSSPPPTSTPDQSSETLNSNWRHQRPDH